MPGQTLFGRLKRRFYSRDKVVLRLVTAFLLLQEHHYEYEWGRISLCIMVRINRCDDLIRAYRQSKEAFSILMTLIIDECHFRLMSDHFKSYFKENKAGSKYTDTEREWLAYMDIFEFCLSELERKGFIDKEASENLIFGVEKIRFMPE